MAARSMGPLSAWDNFSDSYTAARQARAREERDKEASLRAFDENRRQDEQNQRLWNQEGRTDDLYQSYTKPFNAYGLDNARMANELGIAGHGGNMAEAGLKTDVRRQLYTPENVTQEVARVNADRNLTAKIAQLRNEIPDGVLKSAAARNFNIAAEQSVDGEQNYSRRLSPEYLKNKKNVWAAEDSQSNALLSKILDETKAEDTARAIANRPASTYGDMRTPRMYSTTSGVTPQPQAAKATATPAPPAAPVAQSPMAAMTAKQPTLAEGYDATIKAIKDVEQQIGLIDLKTRIKNPEVYKQLETQLQILNAQRKNQANAMLFSPESLAQRKVFLVNK